MFHSNQILIWAFVALVAFASWVIGSSLLEEESFGTLEGSERNHDGEASMVRGPLSDGHQSRVVRVRQNFGEGISSGESHQLTFREPEHFASDAEREEALLELNQEIIRLSETLAESGNMDDLREALRNPDSELSQLRNEFLTLQSN